MDLRAGFTMPGGSRLRGWRSAVHKSGGASEISRRVGRRGGKPASPVAVAAAILGGQTWISWGV